MGEGICEDGVFGGAYVYLRHNMHVYNQDDANKDFDMKKWFKDNMKELPSKTTTLDELHEKKPKWDDDTYKSKVEHTKKLIPGWEPTDLVWSRFNEKCDFKWKSTVKAP